MTGPGTLLLATEPMLSSELNGEIDPPRAKTSR